MQNHFLGVTVPGQSDSNKKNIGVGLCIRMVALCALLSIVAGPVFAQPDSLLLNNGDIIVGELKDMNRGLMTVETGYSDSDFKIEWEDVRMVRTTSQYMVETEDGHRITSRILSVDTVVTLTAPDDTVVTTLGKIVFLKSVKSDFWSRANISIDLGFDITKANNFRQFSLRSLLGYQTDRWQASATFNSVNSTQDDVEDIKRTDLDLSFRWSLPKQFFVGVDASFLSNTEQLLNLRSSIQPSVGNYLVRNNSMYWLVLVGTAFTHEDYSTADPDRSSTEGMLGTEVNLFDMGDLNLLLSSKVFSGLGESGRLRMDHRFDVKYDLTDELYMRIGLTVNYDNQPVAGATETDYVNQLALGWEL